MGEPRVGVLPGARRHSLRTNQNRVGLNGREGNLGSSWAQE